MIPLVFWAITGKHISSSLRCGILLSPGLLNQETIVWRSLALHFVGSKLFCGIASTFFCIFSWYAFLLFIAANPLSVLAVFCSTTCWCTVPLLRHRLPAAKGYSGGHDYTYWRYLGTMEPALHVAHYGLGLMPVLVPCVPQSCPSSFSSVQY